MQHSRRNQVGDTIVEVVIAVMVVSVLLAGAFAVTNRSARAVRDSEEHAQALQLLQGQLELLRHAAAQPATLTALPSISQPFCLDSAGVIHQPASTSSQCLITSSFGAGSTLGYRLAIVSPTSSPATCNTSSCSTTTFNLTASWPSLNGGTNTVYLSYKVAVQQ